MAFGTASVPRVDVIAGPGNAYVAEAKRQVSGVVGVASAFAGPSEIVVVAGPGAPPEFVAIDLVVQAEHGPDGLAWLVTWDEALLAAVSAEVDRIVAASPRRADLEATLATVGHRLPGRRARTTPWPWPTRWPPSTCRLMVDDPAACVDQVQNAGAVFVGPWSPASFGDYIAGPNHVLPTNRTARFSSALRADDFRRHIHAVTVTPGALATLGPPVITLADTEGLPAHADSVRRRLAALAATAADARRPSRHERPPAHPARPLAHRGLPLAPGRGRGAAQHQRVALPAAREVEPRPPAARWPRCRSTATPTGRPPSCGPPSPRCTTSTPEEVFCANGSNEVLQCLLLAYGGPGRKAAVFEPTYALHSHISRLTGTTVVEGGRTEDFRIDPDEARALLDREQPDITFFCSPNNPTGRAEPKETVAGDPDRRPGSRHRR